MTNEKVTPASPMSLLRILRAFDQNGLAASDAVFDPFPAAFYSYRASQLLIAGDD